MTHSLFRWRGGLVAGFLFLPTILGMHRYAPEYSFMITMPKVRAAFGEQSDSLELRIRADSAIRVFLSEWQKAWV